MINLYNFDNIPQNNKTYGGTAGIKVGVTIDGVDYLIKYPGKLKDLHMKNVDLSYSNGPVCEYIGCKIYQNIGVPVQNTFLGIRHGKVVVACEDFLGKGDVLIPYRDIKATFEPAFTDPQGDTTNGTGTNIHEIIRTFHEHPLLLQNPQLENRFWDMFVVDALIGNPDRNNENWGLIRNFEDEYRLAPVFDCGNCLYNKMSEQQMLEKLSSPKEMEEIAIMRPCIFERKEGKRINAYSYIQNKQNEKCNDAVLRIVPCINLGHIRNLIYEIPDTALSEVHKRFYDELITTRYERVLESTLRKIKEQSLDGNDHLVGTTLSPKRHPIEYGPEI